MAGTTDKRESEIESAVVRFAKSKGCYVRKFKAVGNRGVPDRLFLTKFGLVFFIEFKRKGKDATPLQAREIRMIKKNNGEAYVVDSIESGKALVAKLTEQT